VALLLESGDLCGEARELVGIEGFSSGGGKNSGAEFDNDPLFHGVAII
jgi:hypothetical protein